MTDLRTAAQQVLEALEWYRQEYRDIDGGTRFDWTDKAAKDLRAALAQQAEPVAWMYPDDYAGILKHQSRAEVFQKAWCNPAVCVPLYTAPPQRKPLTDEEIEQLLSKYERNYDMVNFARAIERAHGIK